ncbi:MAG: tRNA (adenosine(37)-N6)-threonylcarbamoyltransferase complex dimerization subunit type 1 TsaB [Ureaplasma sp.]|nr:tRNA (adenosine(37)-N6)-threonylcarbamoyltransferase complex dimerization subunit type 1 TsaB [Ureaplasma sp.]MDE7221654.1 tRNA (adenosine(37)-N6)-threonylcarbamoyltransferase complex dimerization subunit type 1 TsaB [Ureaplasma sp.]
MPNFYLFFNLSFSKCSFKLLDVNFTEVAIENFDVSKNLINIVNEKFTLFLKKNNISFANITRIYFCNGPGNFTGIRVANSIAKTISLVYPNIKFYMINNLQWMSMDNGVSLITANNSYYYCAVYQNSQEIIYPHLIKKSEVNKYIDNFKNLNLIIDDFSNVVSNPNIWMSFKLIDDLINLEPFYIKEPV